ncbi:MAG TPA: hypothetical protein VGC79_36610, partial [Polyangiaceae bacterium]
WTVPSSLGFIVGSIAAPLLVRHLRPESALICGLSVSVLGFCVLAQTSPGSHVAYVVVGSVLLAVGVAPVMTLSTDRIVGFAPPERAGAAAALSETGAELGGALGIALLGSVVSAVYRRQMSDLDAFGLSALASSTTRDTLSGALASAPELPAALSQALLARARQGFTSGMHWTAAFSALVLIGLALVTARQLRLARLAPSQHSASAGPAER